MFSCVFAFSVLLTVPLQVRVLFRGLHSGSHSRHVLLTSHSRGSLLTKTQVSLFCSDAIRDTACSSVTTAWAPEHSVRLLRHVRVSLNHHGCVRILKGHCGRIYTTSDTPTQNSSCFWYHTSLQIRENTDLFLISHPSYITAPAPVGEKAVTVTRTRAVQIWLTPPGGYRRPRSFSCGCSSRSWSTMRAPDPSNRQTCTSDHRYGSASLQRTDHEEIMALRTPQFCSGESHVRASVQKVAREVPEHHFSARSLSLASLFATLCRDMWYLKVPNTTCFESIHFK